MKTIKLVTAMAGMALFFTSCNESINNVEDTFSEFDIEKSAENYSVPADSCVITFSGTLTEAEIEGLLEMREEEKLARDVYKKLYEIHNIPVFNNISKSEEAHTSAVLYLLNGYKIEDPALAAEGEFTNTAFGELYNAFIEKGSENLVEALKVGAFIEEYDIADLWNLLEETQNEDIKRVYGNLLRGSEIHLRAFTNILKLQGITYEPTIITAEEYLQIIAVEDEPEDTETPSTTSPGTCDGTGPNA